jgi:tetratricopeptide (TPR) repeat protein
MAQGWILTTLHFVAEAEKAAYPRTAEAFRKKIVDRYGSPLPAPRARPEADRLRGAFQHVARGEFEAGRSELEGMSGGPGPAWWMSEIAALGVPWGDLGPPTGRGPPSPPPRRGMPGAREDGPFDSDHRLCRKLSFFVARQRGRRPFSPAMPQTVTPNAISLRIDAALLSEAGRSQEALEKLDLALAASPEDLFARLDRAGALKRLGRNEASGREYDAASKMAVDLGFPRAVTDEITDRRPGPR